MDHPLQENRKSPRGVAALARRLRLVIGVLALVLALGAAGCGSSKSSGSGNSGNSGSGATTTSQTHFAKTKFVLHAGLAFGAFHRYIYKPLKAGDFSHPLRHKLAIVKAAVAAAFTYHELKLALEDAKSSKILSKLVSPVTALIGVFQGLKDRIKGGNVDPGQLEQANTQISSLKDQSSASGQPIAEQAPAL